MPTFLCCVPGQNSESFLFLNTRCHWPVVSAYHVTKKREKKECTGPDERSLQLTGSISVRRGVPKRPEKCIFHKYLRALLDAKYHAALATLGVLSWLRRRSALVSVYIRDFSMPLRAVILGILGSLESFGRGPRGATASIRSG